MRKCSGGVIYNKKGEILLRKPKNGFGGYSWTFAKGGVDKDESLRDAAVREVKEETGYDCYIVKVLGVYLGETTVNHMYLMRTKAGARQSPFDDETEQLRWCSIEEAETLIGETPNRIGRLRDLKILRDASAQIVNIIKPNKPLLSDKSKV